MKDHFARRALAVKRSAIRELLKLTEKPDIISFAGGLPDPETFPREELARIAADELRGHYRNVLQYGLTEGSLTFRQALLPWLRTQGLHLELGQLLVTTASQQGLDLLGKAFIDPGDVVFCDLPTYLGAIQAFSLFQADKVGVPLLEDGMDVDVLEERIREAKRAKKTLKAIYVIPDFQNPTGITTSWEKRKRLLEIARREDLLIFEDNPYGELRFAGEPIPSIRSMDTEGRVIMLVTLSKVLSAGLRLAVLIADGELMEVLVRMKQATDLCTSKLTQHLAARYFNECSIEDHLKELRVVYRGKRDAMVAALERYMPTDEGIIWTHPDGGLFLWVSLPEELDTDEMFPHTLEHKVAYVPGKAFFVDGTGHNTMRLSFSVSTEAEIDEGIRRLSAVVREELAAKRVGSVA
ncbi:MAG: PLP-dependent aminotransferase family protein [Candidatus Bipolaricaulota bacterium]|nr:PLP-dependent aminotransferase family protein [Candidatus Bipolaricaulota bacterium]